MSVCVVVSEQGAILKAFLIPNFWAEVKHRLVSTAPDDVHSLLCV